MKQNYSNFLITIRDLLKKQIEWNQEARKELNEDVQKLFLEFGNYNIKSKDVDQQCETMIKMLNNIIDLKENENNGTNNDSTRSN